MRRKMQGRQWETLHLRGEVPETFFSKSPVLKVPRQCPLILLVEVYARKSKGLGRERYEA
jgi:hypothetical protein